MAGGRDFGMKAALATAVTSVFGTRAWVRREPWAFVLGVSGGLAAMVLAAQVRIPVLGTDVPMTLQSFGVLLVGFALRPPQAVAAVLLYLGCGAAGLGVFAAGSTGLSGPTGGYLVGFVAASWLVSTLTVRGRSQPVSFVRLLAAGAAGMVVILTLGVAGRVLALGGDVGLAIRTGLLPFAGKSVVELFLAVSLVTSLRGMRRSLSGTAPKNRFGGFRS